MITLRIEVELALGDPPTLAPTHSLLADAVPGHNYASTLRIRRHTFVFVSQRGMPRTTAGFARMIERAAVRALASIVKAANIKGD